MARPAQRRQFRYALDPLCLLACVLYAVNRWVMRDWLPFPLFQSHFNDALVIPAALPCVLWIQRLFGLRPADRMPTGTEVAFHVAVWSLLFEGIAPLCCPTVADPWDVLAYSIGGLLAWFLWSSAGSDHAGNRRIG